MNYLITGGAGFIGSHLSKHLSKIKKNNITIIDLRSKIKQIKKIKTIKYIEGDISDYKTFSKIKKKIDYAYHFAAQTSAQIGEENPNKNFRTNIIGTQNFVNWAYKNNPKICYFTSSMAVYGANCKNAQENSFCEPVSNYGISKLVGEFFFKKLKEKKIDYKILRLFNIYGPGQDLKNLKQGMISIYIAQALKNKVINVTGSLNRTRDFLYIDDLIKILLSNKFSKFETYNVGFGKEIKVHKVFKILNQIFENRLKIKKKDKSKGDIFYSYANIDRLKKLNIKPKINIEKGIAKFLNEIK